MIIFVVVVVVVGTDEETSAAATVCALDATGINELGIRVACSRNKFVITDGPAVV